MVNMHKTFISNAFRRHRKYFNNRYTVQNIGKWQRFCSQHFVDGRPTPQHTHQTLFDYNNFKVSKSPGTPTARTPQSTHWCLVMPYSDKGLGQHWLRLWLVAWWPDEPMLTENLGQISSLVYQIWMYECKAAVTRWLMHWSYCSHVLNHWCIWSL